jgi:catechol 2,3-dioxygenase-like lactoylglutathione lyase family enzyme
MFTSTPLYAALPASDLDRALAWYEDKLGLKPAQADEGVAAWFETGGSRFMVYASAFAGSNPATAAGFTVDDFDAAMSQLRGAGVVFEDYDFGDEMKTVDGVFTTPDGERACWFKDSEGNILAISTM